MLRSEFIDKMNSVANILNYPVEYSEETLSDKHRHTAHLRKENEHIIISSGQYGKLGSLGITAWFPRSDDGYQYSPKGNYSINCTEKKSSVQVASDIRRRLLPQYTEALAKVLIQVEDRNAEIKRASECLHSVADALGVKPSFMNSMETSGDGRVYTHDFYGLEATYRTNGKFEVRLNLSVNDVLELIKHLKRDRTPDFIFSTTDKMESVAGVPDPPISFTLFEAIKYHTELYPEHFENSNIEALLKSEVDRQSSLTPITITESDVTLYARKNDLAPEETQHLINHLDEIVQQLIIYIEEVGWRNEFENACGAYITGYRMQHSGV